MPRFRTLLSSLPLLLCLSATAQADRDHAGFAADYPDELRRQLQQALADRPAAEIRSKHLDADGRPRYTNRLLLADSPYLQQHAHNPIDWHPWNEATRAKARADNRLILLSIGYATCHWCHVMEDESFDNPALAVLINANFLPVKVDRESQPNVDRAYMTAVQRMSGRGGWPLNVVLTPQGHPLAGGSYFPPAIFERWLAEASAAYHADPDTAAREAEARWRETHRDLRLGERAAALDPALLARARETLVADMDELQGGFGHAPKFPLESRLLFLLDEHARRPDETLAENLRLSLDQMARGALFDQLAGGFHRYAVDNGWQQPHFEKMLYTQADLLLVYLRAWEQFGNPDDARVVQLTADYLLRDLRHPSGLFYAATDADSEGEEGRYFSWTRGQIETALGRFGAERLLEHYAIAPPVAVVVGEAGNVDSGPLVVREDAEFSAPPPEVEALRERLRQVRETRVAPLTDTKLITAWNARAISVLAQAGAALGRADWSRAAEQALEQLWRQSYRPGLPLPRYAIGATRHGDGTLEDYAGLLEALLTQHRLSAAPQWLERARELGTLTLLLFADRDSGALYETRLGAKHGLGFRPRSNGDNPGPDSTGTALRAFAQLYRASGERQWQRAADGVLASQAGSLQTAPQRWAWLLHQWRNWHSGERGAQQWAAYGKVRVAARRREGEVLVELDIAPGWHVQSDRPSHPDLIATELRGADGRALPAGASPGAELVATGIKRTPMSLFSGRQRLTLDTAAIEAAEPLSLILQACDDKLCLPPETLALGWVR